MSLRGASDLPECDSTFDAQAVMRLRAAFQTSRQPMLIADDQRRWVTGNTAASELLGIALEEVPWHTMDDFTPPSERPRLEEQWQAFLASGTAEGWYQLSVPDRELLQVEFSATANVLPSRHLAVFLQRDLIEDGDEVRPCLLYTSPSPRDRS